MQKTLHAEREENFAGEDGEGVRAGAVDKGSESLRFANIGFSIVISAPPI